MGGSSTVFYSTEKNWSTYNVHYQVGSGAWTTAPGKAMTAACTGWVKADIDLGTATTWKAAFNNGSTWDNNSGSDYTLATGIQAVKGGKITTTDPCGTVIPEQPLGNELALYYSTTKNWSAYNAHYQVGTGAWTTVPGKAMTAACTGWVTTTIPTTGATSVTAAFTNGTGTWDNNGSKNYTFTTPTAAVNNGTITTTNPCPDTATPGTPSNVKATASGNTVNVTWTASTGATIESYLVTRTGPGTTTVTKTVTGTSLADTGLAYSTSYGYTVTAKATNGKSSAASPQSLTTTGKAPGTAAPAVPTGLKAVPAGKDLKITWNAPTGATKYVVVIAAAGQPTKTVTVTSASLTTTDLVANTAYKVKVRAANATGQSSAYTAVVTATTGTAGTPTTPAVPTGLAATAAGKDLKITWNASAGATKYSVVLAATGQTTKTVTVTGTTLTTTDLVANTAYKIKVRASNTAGTSAYTAVISATTAGGTPTTPQPTTQPTPTPTPQPTTPPGPGTAVGTDHSVALYKTNPNGQVGKSKTITVDGNPSDWTADMLIAQGVANDDPRIFRGSHEGPVYDPYSLYGAWDAENLYLMWQFTNVTDVVDPAQGYPISDNGKPANGDIPQALAFDVNSRGGDGLEDGEEKGIWGMRYKFDNKEVDHLALFSSKPGVGQPALFSLNANDAFDYEPANVAAFKASGISFAYGDGFFPTTLMGIKKNGYEGYTPADLTDASKFTDLLKAGHSTKQDTIYEIKIPLAKLGTTKAQLEANGLGVMLITTFGQSAIGSLPYDPATLDNATKPYSADESTSAEKEDWDGLTAKFARVGK
ncbi:fibronectin type III domain-containing protein [Agromyces atrinae]|nr:fibronectin type III domain-containing protein [Agromyces atrinae]